MNKKKEKDLAWIKDLENPEEFLDKDMKLVYEYCGIDTVINLLEGVPAMTIYTSKSSVNRAQEKYIHKHFDGSNAKKLALKIGCSESHIYKVNKKHRKAALKEKPKTQKNLFEA